MVIICFCVTDVQESELDNKTLPTTAAEMIRAQQAQRRVDFTDISKFSQFIVY